MTAIGYFKLLTNGWMEVPKYKSAVQIGNTVEEEGATNSDFPQTLDPPIDAIYVGYDWDNRGTWETVEFSDVEYKDLDDNTRNLTYLPTGRVTPIAAKEIVSITPIHDDAVPSWYSRSGTVGLREK